MATSGFRIKDSFFDIGDFLFSMLIQILGALSYYYYFLFLRLFLCCGQVKWHFSVSIFSMLKLKFGKMHFQNTFKFLVQSFLLKYNNKKCFFFLVCMWTSHFLCVKGHNQKNQNSDSTDKNKASISAKNKCPWNNFKQKVAIEYIHTSSDIIHPSLCYTLKVFIKPTHCERKYILLNFHILNISFS